MSNEEEYNNALRKISLPFHEIKVWLSCTQSRKIEFAITNPTNVTIGFHLRNTRTSVITVYPMYGFIKKNSHVMIQVHFPKVDECSWVVRADRLTVLLAVKPECISMKQPELLWDETTVLPEIYARRCITINYTRPFENETIKKCKAKTKGKTTTDEQIHKQKKQSRQHVKAEVVADVQSDDNDECEEEESNEDFTDNEKSGEKQDKQ
ncbi:hypothetical protein T4B_3996 [Trichinella pseudospiralis]|uniref:MSP domain-containing protein n=2 Tax=Trichinella pseudospiralis TaxID=6337 RepID=A0A0V1EIM2_TRIPS|nr:hypothetical protein T4E_1264 [Trichinella pseudospiralis]KRY73662.1 hypothetical protein T4A_13733 [Trichinella pseudospiralis]KRY89135.1 hypothetical protein T4D_13912 [Trichinella pseudospiralis]KRZ21309.1 hypothetical protein T4B_3996 [Trichinella pseudospiralis]KRZ37610.1 hypothetical protein T4C_12701 [Trichinella pseudospiralis]